MSVRQKFRSASKSETVAIDSMLGPPPLLPGEDVSAYETLIARVSADLQPADVIEEIWIRDVVYHTWEIIRWRRIKMIRTGLKMSEFLTKWFAGTLYASPQGSAQTENTIREASKKLASRWFNGDPEVLNSIKQAETANMISITDSVGLLFFNDIDAIERIDQMLSVLEIRRNAVLREIERRRATLGRSLRDGIQKAEDAEYQVIKLKSPPRKSKVSKKAA